MKRQFSRYLFREDLIGAYVEDELIGFIMLANAGRYGVLGQIISKIQHRDKSPNNALIAKAVEVCARKGLPHLVYAYWGDGSLANFKRHNGFEEIRHTERSSRGQHGLASRLEGPCPRSREGSTEDPPKPLADAADECLTG